MAPDSDDLVARKTRDAPDTVFVLGSVNAPTQFQVRTRDEAVSRAAALARRLRVRAWFVKSDHDVVLLGTL